MYFYFAMFIAVLVLGFLILALLEIFFHVSVDGDSGFERKSSGDSNNRGEVPIENIIHNVEVRKRDHCLQPFPEKAYEKDADDAYELGECEPLDRGFQDSGAGVEGEDRDTSDELQLYKSHEDEYEIFELRIIHRKNR